MAQVDISLTGQIDIDDIVEAVKADMDISDIVQEVTDNIDHSDIAREAVDTYEFARALEMAVEEAISNSDLGNRLDQLELEVADAQRMAEAMIEWVFTSKAGKARVKRERNIALNEYIAEQEAKRAQAQTTSEAVTQSL
ncbi:hypothetical protein UFOVP361_133 [uncultured Caudovirales phage]|uniref:Uncharacterized protein n=1 Tax=uncultured Caudovirales phage TaxID=2100421 RepID=A0A6J7X4U8_9CAUD|nr:hypothetical protein UFOVP361_133 [uncultured Caudovirales phage]